MIRRLASVAIAAALFAPAAALAQQASVQGFVTSASSGAPLEGVTVVLEAAGRSVQGTVTDRNGFYQIGGVAPGTYSLRGRHIGYVLYDRSITLAAGQRLTASFGMEPEAVSLEGVTVTPRQGAVDRDLGRQRVTPGDIRLVPVPAGTGDLATYLQTLPGVVTTGDRGGQLFVRGGTAAENLVLLDGIPIYQPFHIVGFFSVFPEDLVSSADFYASGFGARYSGRTASVLDVGIRDGDQSRYRGVASVSPFVAEVLAEGPAGEGISWIASARRSLVDETSEALIGERQPLTFESQLVKLSFREGEDLRCSLLGLRTSDRGQLDPQEDQSHVGWENRLVGGRCVTQFQRVLRLVEVNFSYSTVDNSAVSRGTADLRSSAWRMQNDAHTTSMLASIPLYFGYHMYAESTDFDMKELFGLERGDDGVFGFDAYAEAAIPLAGTIELRPGVMLTGSPRGGVEPRLRASWEPLGRPSEKVQAAVGLYRQDLVGTSDMRDVSSVFTAWMSVPDQLPLEATHATLGWQQSIGEHFSWSTEGYYKRMKDVPVPVWRGFAQFTTRLGRADGEIYGVDTRVEITAPRFYGFVGYGYGWTEYEATEPSFYTWFGDSVMHYHPPHDRRHQVNALASLDVAGFRASARWQLGSGLPFTRPLGFDEAFDYTVDLHDVRDAAGASRLVIDRPFTGRLPVMHRLDLSVERGFDLPIGRLLLQGGAINAYDRRNMFYYDLFSGRRVDQLPLVPYLSLTVRGK